LLAIVLLGRVQSVQVTHVSSQLLYGACSECVAGGNQHREVVLDQPEADLEILESFYTNPNKCKIKYLGEIGGFSDSVYAAESHDEGTSLAL
jgi:hypothetical protein